MPGHIRKRGKDSYTVVVDQGRDPLTGKRRRLWRTVTGNKKQAEALLVQLLHERDTGIDQPPGRMTLADFLNQWMTDYAINNASPKTIIQYRYLIDRHIVPALGAVHLSKLRPPHVQNFYSEALRTGRTDGTGGLSPKTVLHIHRLLRQALSHAVRWQMLGRNPADAAEPPRPGRYLPPVLTRDDVHRLMEAANHTRYGALVHLVLMTGLRRGEACGLRWNDVDLDGGVLRVSQNLQWLPHDGFSFREPKTEKSRRAVAIGATAVQVLREHRLRQLESVGRQELVFTSATGTPIGPSNLRRVWTRITGDAGLPDLTFHGLRHVHASLLLIGGTHPKIVSERLGHADVGITMNVYSHLLPTMQAEAVAGLDRWLAVNE